MADFKVDLRETTAHLIGHLEDSTQFDTFRFALEKADSLSFAKIHSMSWLGLQNLVHYLEGLQQPFSLSEVSAPVFRQLMLFLPAKGHLQVAKLEVATYQGGQRQSATVSMEDLVNRANQQGPFVTLDAGLRVVGSMGHVCRSRGLSPDYGQSVQPWFIENHGEFWHSYASFARLTVESCAWSQKAALMLVEELLHQVLPTIKGLNRFCKELGFDDPRYQFKEHAGLYQKIVDFSDKNFAMMFQLADAFASRLVRMEEAFIDKGLTHPENAFAHALAGLHGAIDDLRPITLELDGAGCEVGESLQSLQYVFDWEDQLCQNHEDNEKFTKLLRRQTKKSEMTGQEWMQQQFEHLRVLFHRATVTLQQFDLIKQVLEHRLLESPFLLQWLNSKPDEHSMIRQNLIDQIKDRMVTDLEKTSFRFFFPDEEQAQSSELNAGDLMFF